MLKHRRLVLAAATAIAVTGTAAGVTAASASPRTDQAVGRTEYVQIMSASTAPGPAGAIARGAFAAAGRADLGDARVGTIVFPGGTIVLNHQAGHGSSQFDPRACLSVISQAGTYQIAGGTGSYAGIRGHGTYQLSLEIVAARSHGKCSSTRPPVAQQELLRLSGPVRL
jgi:hypothetical protein